SCDGGIAASTADTWAREIGLCSKAPPRLITARVLLTRAEVRPGTSGGVTWLGTIAACVGAAVIAGFSMAWLETQPAAIWLAGLMGMMVDSILGATVEGRVRGLTIDAANLLATLSRAVLAVVSAGGAGARQSSSQCSAPSRTHSLPHPARIPPTARPPA